MKDFWNERYGKEEFIYGTMPNQFFKQQLEKLKPGEILLPAEGEGRNAVYAASQGWTVTAFDSSERGKEKGLMLAEKKNVSIDYAVTSVLEFQSDTKYDVIGLIYAHFPSSFRPSTHQRLISHLKPGGKIIFEAFSINQLLLTSGGPKDKKMLFSVDDIKKEFKGIDFEILTEESITLNEGKYHKGLASVVRMFGTKSKIDDNWLKQT